MLTTSNVIALCSSKISCEGASREDVQAGSMASNTSAIAG
jgi:hypothetical protein